MTGGIEADQVDIATKRAGRIEAVLVAEGNLVEVGQMMARMTVTDLQADFREAEANLRQAREEKRRASAMISQRDSDLRRAIATIAQRESDLRQGCLLHTRRTLKYRHLVRVLTFSLHPGSFLLIFHAKSFIKRKNE